MSWGLSAAGYLDPKIFRFFQRNGILVNSGFGMTEATGGITMTPPGQYEENSTGIPLPGTRTRFKENGELEINGHYIVRYLEDAAPGDIIPYPTYSDSDYWLATGDIFRVSENGFYEIIDRVKDIYKNNKGQTIAPRTIEKKFTNVPGIDQTFLVGDALPYNVLLIVPDYKNPIFESLSTEESRTEYFHQIVMSANQDVANYERVVNFAVLDRNFSADKGELTPKGSYNRKMIEKNFESIIRQSYKRNHIRFQIDKATITIPRWFYRDLSILESDIVLNEEGLYNTVSKKQLIIKQLKSNSFRIGDLIYEIASMEIDLGRIVRHPMLWMGNTAIIQFCPVKASWDLPLKTISEQVCRAKTDTQAHLGNNIPNLNSIKDPMIVFANNLITQSLFAEKANALSATEQLSTLFNTLDARLAAVIRGRLASLSCHPEKELRILAYRILLIEDPNPDYTKTFPVFLQSGLPFLDEQSIKEIAFSNIGKKNLEALRQRLFTYRTKLDWPIDNTMRQQFSSMLKLLFNFGSQHLEYYISIRSELASWILHKKDPQLSEEARKYFKELFLIFESNVLINTPSYTPKKWESWLKFEDGILQTDITRISKVFSSTQFIKQSVILAYNELDFHLETVKTQGIWISRVASYLEYRHFRITINTTNGKHYDLHLVMNKSEEENPLSETIYWLTALANFPYGSQTLPTQGCSRSSMRIRTTKYIGELNTWERIRSYSDMNTWGGNLENPNAWRKLFIKAIATFFKTWRNSGYQIVPGALTPANVVVPERDFKENALIITLTSWRKYKNTLSLIVPIVENFYNKTVAHYPWVQKQLKADWIFDAIIEALDQEEANVFFGKLRVALDANPQSFMGEANLKDALLHYIDKNKDKYYLPLSLYNAIDQYSAWEKINPSATDYAKEQMINELYELYKIYQLPDVARFYLYKETFFSKLKEDEMVIFDRLIDRMQQSSLAQAVQFVELSDLQEVLWNKKDKSVFSKMVFPKLQTQQKIDIIKLSNDKKGKIIVRTILKDSFDVSYTFREPIGPSEVGQLYKLFYQENYPKTISKMDKHFVITDVNDRVIGGLCYKMLEDQTVLLDGSAITSSLQNRRLGSAMINDFFARMSSLGMKLIKAHFLFGNYYLKHNFKVDKKWGALVRYIDENEEALRTI